MEIKIKGEMTIAEVRQAIFEKLQEIETDYAVRYSRGANLSGGQRQRVAIARALFTNPRILIFDEATSALDEESERVVRDNLMDMAKGRTMIIISHKGSVLERATRVIKIEEGGVV